MATPISFHDAHCHRPTGAGIPSVVNGTSPSDWPTVLELANQDASVLPAIGLHPWKVKDAPSDWQTQFLQALPKARAIGEIGLDQWIEDVDIEQQQAAFRWQLAQAAERNLPVSIHCLKASEPLLRVLKSAALPTRGIHLHAYSGSAEQVKVFAELGTYFSFNAAQFKPNAKKVLTAVREIPADRLLIETDAPDTLQVGEDACAFLKRGYQHVAELRGVSTESLAQQVTDNFKRYFLDD